MVKDKRASGAVGWDVVLVDLGVDVLPDGRREADDWRDAVAGLEGVAGLRGWATSCGCCCGCCGGCC